MFSTIRFGGGGIVHGTPEQVERKVAKIQQEAANNRQNILIDGQTQTNEYRVATYLTDQDIPLYQGSSYIEMLSYLRRNWQAQNPQNPSTPHVKRGRSFITGETFEEYTCRNGID